MDIRLEDSHYTTNQTYTNLNDTLSCLSVMIVLTPNKSDTQDVQYQLEHIKRTKTGIIKMTPKDYVKHNKCIPHTHIVVEDIELMKDYGYDKCINTIINKYKKYLVFVNNKSTTYLQYVDKAMVLCTNKYCIDAKDEYIYLCVYVLCKSNKNIQLFCKNAKKMRIFCDATSLECDITDKYDGMYIDKVCIVLDEYIEISAKKVVYIGFDIDARRICIDYNKTGRLLYRIRDLLKCITKAVIQGKRSLNMTRFKNISKI